ncbi:MAG TPA: hypothetical protein DDW17_07745 [Deltaproteobacteria bacterium]|nr:hypothetical protein [Deltaproteobacteria bacterium]
MTGRPRLWFTSALYRRNRLRHDSKPEQVPTYQSLFPVQTTQTTSYIEEASHIYDNLQICKYIKKWVSEDDLVWTRDAEGQYYLARVTSGWEYWTTHEAIDLDIDVANIFRCDIKNVDIDAVPGKVVSCFRATRTIQEIADEKAREYSKKLWNMLSNKEFYQIDKSKYSDIFMMLDAEETEDLLFLYLQSLGWHVVPHSRKRDTMSFEYLLVNPVSGERALSQVKTGGVTLNRDDYAHYPYKIFLFQSNDRYAGGSARNVVCVSRGDLLTFLNKSLDWIPKSFKAKVELINK